MAASGLLAFGEAGLLCGDAGGSLKRARVIGGRAGGSGTTDCALGLSLATLAVLPTSLVDAIVATVVSGIAVVGASRVGRSRRSIRNTSASFVEDNQVGILTRDLSSRNVEKLARGGVGIGGKAECKGLAASVGIAACKHLHLQRWAGSMGCKIQRRLEQSRKPVEQRARWGMQRCWP